jgi:hypothetical protein
LSIFFIDRGPLRPFADGMDEMSLSSIMWTSFETVESNGESRVHCCDLLPSNAHWKRGRLRVP